MLGIIGEREMKLPLILMIQMTMYISQEDIEMIIATTIKTKILILMIQMTMYISQEDIEMIIATIIKNKKNGCLQKELTWILEGRKEIFKVKITKDIREVTAVETVTETTQ